MTIDLWQPKVERYVDAELSEQEMRDMDAHLRECPACASRALRLVQLKQATKLAGRRYAPSADFRRKMAAELGGRKRAGWHWGWIPVFAAAAIFVVVGAAILHQSTQQGQSRQLLAELTDLHVADLAASNPVDVISTDRHTVKPWFQGKLPFSFNLPELAGTPFTLLGGRLTYLDHEPGAHLIYNVGAHHVSVFIFRDQADLERAFPAQPSSRNLLSFHVDAWSSRGLRYFVVGDAAAESIEQLSGLLQKSALQ